MRLWRRARRRVAIVAAVLLMLTVWATWSWYDAASRAQLASDSLKAIEKPAQKVHDLQALLTATSPWCARTPGYLDALAALTLQFPADGTIWLTNCELDELRHLTISGSARGQGDVLALVGRLETSGQFDQIVSHFVRRSTSNGIVTFSIGCRHRTGASS